MFEINSNKKTNTDLATITNNYQILHFDDEPVLFTGFNKYGNRLIGSILEFDDENIERFLHSIVDTDVYRDFVKQKITYLDVLNTAKNIYVVDINYFDKITNTYIVELRDIPREFIPLENSFCPKFYYQPSLSFSLSLKGKIADENKAKPKDLSRIQNSYSEYLSKIAEAISGVFKLNPEVFLKPSTAGSFKLNFDLKLNENPKKPNLFLNDEDVKKYINNFIDYCLNKFSEEVTDEIKIGKDTNPKLNELFEEFKKIYNFGNSVKDNKLINIFLKNFINATAQLENVAENIGENFTGIEFLNIDKGRNTENFIGFIDNKFNEPLSDSLMTLESTVYEISTDKEPKEYKILIYHLNTDTRQGNALIASPEDQDKNNRPKIKINGDVPLEETKYTESLYKNIWINVKGRATRIDSKFRKIEIDFED